MSVEAIMLPLIGLSLGLVLGSFVGMASWRWPRALGWGGRSHCPTCQTPLKAKDLVPIFSWLLRRGHCGCGKAKVPARYALIEGTTAFLALGAAFIWGASPAQLALMVALAALLVFIAAVDLETGLIPDGANLLLFALGLVWVWLTKGSWADFALSFALLAGISAFLAGPYSKLRGRDMMGWGDVKFMAAAAGFLPPMLVAPFLAIAGFSGVFFGLWWRRVAKESEFPFGPALCFALITLIGWQALAG